MDEHLETVPSELIQKIPKFPTDVPWGFRWNPFARRLPASMLSLLSLLLFAAVLGPLLYPSRMRDLFFLPFPPFVLAGAALLMTGLVAMAGARRPGSRFPRVWAASLFVLCGLSLVGSLLSFFMPGMPGAFVVQALCLACSGAAVMLLPRLLHLRPNGRWLHRVGPLLFLLLLAGLGAGVFFSYQMALSRHNAAIDQKRRSQHNLARLLRDLLRHDWTTVPSAPKDAKRRIDELGKQATSERLREAVPDAGEWRVARLLGRERELHEGYLEVLKAAAAAWDQDNFPRLAHLSSTALETQGDVKGRWQQRKDLAPLSTLVAAYHRTLWQVLSELRPAPTDRADPRAETMALEKRYREERGRVEATLKRIAATYSDAWLVYALPQPDAIVGQSSQTWEQLLGASLVDGAGLPAAALHKLMRMDLGEARKLAKAGKGCVPWDYPKDKEYFFRLDCTSYEPASDGKQARPRLEVRVVWNKGNTSGLPSGVYYTAVSPFEDRYDFEKSLMEAFYKVLPALGAGSVEPLDAHHRLQDGFSLALLGQTLKFQPRVVFERARRKYVIDFGVLKAGEGRNDLATVEIWVKNPLRGE